MFDFLRRLFGLKKSKEKKVLVPHEDYKSKEFSDSEKSKFHNPEFSQLVPPDPKTAKESEILRFIKNASIAEVESWFYGHKQKGHNFFDSIYYAALDKIASKEDEFYLEQLKGMTAEEVKALYREERREGVYFSDTVYQIIMDIINSEKYQKKWEIDLNTISSQRVLTWYLKIADSEAFDYIPDELERIAKTKIETLFKDEKLSIPYQVKLLHYSQHYASMEVTQTEEYLNLIQSAVKENKLDKLNSMYLRKIGEKAEALGDLPRAVTFYEIALSVNSKVGVKKKLKKLKDVLDKD